MNISYPISTFHLRIELEGYPLDYIVKVDLSGWVHECKAVIFDLPEYVQAMMLYDRDDDYRERILARGVLFQYEIVVALAAEYSELKGTMGRLVTQIKAELAERGTKWKELPITESTPEKMVYLRTKSGLSSIEISEELSQGFQSSLGDLIFAVNSHQYDNDDDNILGKAIDFIGRHGGPKGHDILLDFLPVFPASSYFPDDDFFTPLYQSSVPQLIYKALEHERSERTYAALLAALRIKQAEEALHSIFENLKQYDSPETEAAVLKWYHSSESWEENTRPAAAITAGDDILWNVTTGFLQGRTTLLTATALLDTLFDIPFEPDEDYKNLDILRLMEEVFSYTPYDERATPMCLLSLNSENEYLRGAAVNVLGFSGDREILTALEDYLTDSAVVVRQTAQRVLGLEIAASTEPDFEDDLLNWDWEEGK